MFLIVAFFRHLPHITSYLLPTKLKGFQPNTLEVVLDWAATAPGIHHSSPVYDRAPLKRHCCLTWWMIQQHHQSNHGLLRVSCYTMVLLVSNHHSAASGWSMVYLKARVCRNRRVKPGKNIKVMGYKFAAIMIYGSLFLMYTPSKSKWEPHISWRRHLCENLHWRCYEYRHLS